MTRAVEWATAVVAGAAFTAVWLAAVIAGGHSTFPHMTAALTVWSVTAMPSVAAAWILIRRARPAGDGPDRLFTVAAGLMPARRDDWIVAMRAELAYVRGDAARWAFAAGCLRAALAPRGGVVSVVAAAGLAGVAAAYWLPAMTVFAATFVGVFALTVPAAAARVPTVAGFVGLLGVATAVSTMTYLVFTFPSMGEALRPGSAIILAVVLACCARLALAPPRVLMGGRAVNAVALLVSVGLCAGFLLTSRAPSDDGAGMMGYVMFLPAFVLLLVGAAVGGTTSFRSGALAVTWTVLLSTTWLFVLWLVESERWYANGMGLLFDGEGGLPIGLNLKDSIVWVATWLPVWALPLGLLGAAAGAGVRRLATVTQR